jgi:hypothetical protein
MRLRPEQFVAVVRRPAPEVPQGPVNSIGQYALMRIAVAWRRDGS